MKAIGEERRQRLRRMRLYVITGEEGGLAETCRVVEGGLQGGADIIQLRKKEMPKGEQYRLACALRDLTRRHQALLIVNDHADLAIAADADGVHLGQEDLEPAVVRRIGDFANRIIGRSTHSLEQALRAVDEGADYLGVGPVFATPTKPGRPAVGLELVRAVVVTFRLPFVAIGGIDSSNAGAVREAGAPAIAVVRAVYDADDPCEAARALRRHMSASVEVPAS